MRTAKFETEPFTCPSCITKIEGVVGKMAGVEETKVMFNSGKVKVKFDDGLVTAEAIAKAITDLGYPVLKHKVAA